MKNLQQAEYPTFLSEPERFVKWTLTEVASFSLPLLFLGLTLYPIINLASIIVGTFAGYIGYLLVQAIEKHNLGGNLLPVLMYWPLPSKHTFPGLPPSNIREWV